LLEELLNRALRADHFKGGGSVYFDGTAVHIASPSCSVFPLQVKAGDTMKLVAEGHLSIRGIAATKVEATT
jgi:hypothetical protein